MRSLPCWSLLLLLSVAGTSHADGLVELRGTLATLNGSAPIKARLAVQKSSKNGDGDAPKAMSAQSAVTANAGPNGMQISYDAATLAKVEAEANQRSSNAEATTPLADLLRDITPTQVNSMLSFAGPLLRRLEKATLKADAADTLDGKAARLLTFEVPPNVSKKDRESMKDYSGTLKVWLDGDGTPLAIDQQQVFSGRRMLISFKGSNSETATLRRDGERLVMVSQKRGQTFSGFGQTNDSSTTTTLTIQ